MRAPAALACSLAVALGGTASARADQVLLDGPVQASGVFSGHCFESTDPGPGISSFSFQSPGYGYLRLSLNGGGGDWDLAAFSSGRVVTAAAGAGPDEVATGYEIKGEQIVVRVCRNAGASGVPTVHAELHPLPYPDDAPPELLRVSTPDRASRQALADAGVDAAEGGLGDRTSVVAYGAADQRALSAAGLEYEVVQRDLGADSLKAVPQRAAAGALPSGRTSYRRLYDYEQEMKDLAAANPGLVRLFTLPYESGEGRAVEGIELGDNPGVEEGEPVFLQMGLHHGREWPSGEVAIEWAYELLRSAAAGERRAISLLRDTKTLVVPVVSPDSFNVSRESGQLREDFGIRYGDKFAGIPIQSEEYQRKNCRLPGEPATSADCGRISTRHGNAGVDVNRNYGGLWGGPGAAAYPYDDVYRGTGPFSEPETRNVRTLFASNQITAASSIHTFAKLILRPPLVSSTPKTPDESLYKRLGGKLGRDAGYPSAPGTRLYDSSGALEGWSYYATGSIDYTPELGTSDFHPAFGEVIAEWSGTHKRADGGMRAATYDLATFAGRPYGHVVVQGTAPPGGRLLFRKGFQTKTLPVMHEQGGRTKPLRFDERLHTSVDVPADGHFTAHLNPSTRPIVEQRKSGPKREQWKLICLDSSGQSVGGRKIYAERGDRVELNLTPSC